MSLTFDDPQKARKYKPYCLYLIKKKGTPDEDIYEAHPFYTIWGARKYLELIIQDDDFTLETDKTLRTESGIVVREDHLKEIIEYKYTQEQANVDVPWPLTTYAANFRLGRQIAETVAQSKRETREVKRARKEAGMMSVGDIAEELNMDPKEARIILRSLVKQEKLVKPDVGWNWMPEEAGKIKQLIAEHRQG